MSVCAIVLSYKRPQNIERLVLPYIASTLIDRIVISNNNPDLDLLGWLGSVRDVPKVDLVQQPRRSLPGKRFEIALTEPFDTFLCPDDDLFLTTAQIDALLGALRHEPNRVHGVYGEIHSFVNGSMQLGGGIHGIECELDILNRCYAFTRDHLLQMSALARELGYQSVGDTLFVDDMLLSYCGDGPPICHDLGPLDSCETSETPGIATFRESGFDQARMALWLRLAQSDRVQGNRR